MSYQYQTQFAPSGQVSYGWPYVTTLAADASGHIILPISGVSIIANGNFTILPTYPNVILDGSNQTVTLSTALPLSTGAGVYPSGPIWFYQFAQTYIPYLNQLYLIQNQSSTAATIVSDEGTVNSSASFSMSAGSVYVFEFNQSASAPNWTPNLATAGSNFHYW